MDVRKMRTFWLDACQTRVASTSCYISPSMGISFSWILFYDVDVWLLRRFDSMVWSGIHDVDVGRWTCRSFKPLWNLKCFKGRCFAGIVVFWNNGLGIAGEGTVSPLFGLLLSCASVYLLFKALDFIFKDAGYVFEREWDAKQRLPHQALHDWDVKSTRFSQNCMALKRFDGNTFVQIYGLVRGEKSYLRFDLLGCQSRLEFKAFNLAFNGPNLQHFLSQ